MIHHIFANRSNVGDWLSAQGIQALLAPSEIREHLCDEPFVPGTLDSLKDLGADDLVVIGGGGLFMDYFAPFWSGFACLAGRFPFVVWGAGCCDLKASHTRLDEDLLQKVCAASELCIVRDEATRDLLRGLSVPDPVPCPSLLALQPPTAPGFGVLHADNLTTVGEAAFHTMRHAGQTFAQESGRPYVETNNRIRPDSRADLAAVLQQYADADLVLSSRLHGCLIGLAMERPVLAVSGDHKLESFFQAAGLADWLLDAGEVDRVPELLRRLHEQEPIPDFLAQARAANSEVAAAVRELLPTLDVACASPG